MPPVIVGAIGAQSFELVLDRIGAILAVEIPSQATLNSATWMNASVWVDRFIPFDKTELPAINVTLANGNFDGQTAIQTDGVYQYNIDVYLKAKSGPDEPGDALAMNRLQRLMGVCRAILEGVQYIRLGFAAPFIMYRRVISFNIAEPEEKDADSSVMGRIVFEVKVPENVEVITPVDLADHLTSVKLFETESGLLYIYDVDAY